METALVWLTEAKTPPDLRIYAIGDVHGCLEPLQAAHEHIARDLQIDPADDWTIIHLGDFTDRGPDSRGVIEFLLEQSAENPHIVNLMGNHDLMFARAVRGDPQMTRIWLDNGGIQTLANYSLDYDSFIDRIARDVGFDDVIPPEHISFLGGLDQGAHLGDYFFVHAGIDPERSLDDQSIDDLLWIRDRFIKDGREFEAVIVHGHTPTRKVDVRANRLGIDTGAVYGGTLTCLVLDGERKARLGPEGRLPLI